MGKNTVQAKQWLHKYYPDSTSSIQMVEKWFSDFNRVRINTDDAECFSCLNSSVVPENTKKVHEMISSDRKFKSREIAETLKISESSVFTILHKNLSMRKICLQWVPRLLSVERKQQRLDDLERSSYLLQRNKNEKGGNRSKRPRTQMSASKVLASVFWDAHGILLIDCLEKG